jgi:hypothetical protein
VSSTRPIFPRDLVAGRYLDLFIVGGVSAVMAIRFILRLTGYPSLGGARFHIAHMLWGGLLMAAALLICLSFLGNRTRLLAALLGGVGFGTFIDEIGKFITRDNNYFYQPSIALIYIMFVLIYLAFRDVQMRSRISREEYLVNAINDLEEAIINDLQPEERERALGYLGAIAEKDDLILRLAALIEEASVQPHPDGWLRRIRRYVVAGYEAVLARADRFGGLVTLFVLQLVVNAGTVAFIVERAWSAAETDRSRLAGSSGLDCIVGTAVCAVEAIANASDQQGGTFASIPMSDVLLIVSTLVPSVLVIVAVFALRRSRMRGLYLFRRAVLLSILFTEVFMFYRNQAAALVVLAFNLFAWACVNVAITRESRAGLTRSSPLAGSTP